MKILVFTSAMASGDWREYMKAARIKPNPSNQNFYDKLIRALNFHNEVSVISLRPFVKGMFRENRLGGKSANEGDVIFHYAPAGAGRLYKLFHESKVVFHLAEKIIAREHSRNFVIVVDTLRRSLLKAAKAVAKRYGVPIIGVVTDNPANLIGASRSWARLMVRSARKLDGYVVLTAALNRIYNRKNKPSYLLEGLVEDVPETKKRPIGDYFFFGGALYRRYGVKTLLDAYHGLRTDCKLVLAGTGELRQYIFDLVEKDRRILYLDLVDKDTVHNLEQHALANVNPRPSNEKIDAESVPSKLLEYLASGTPTISTPYPKITPMFQNQCAWIKDGSEAGMRKALADFLAGDRIKQKKDALEARIRIYELYGLRPQGEALSRFIASLSASSTA